MAVKVTETAAREIHSIIQREDLDPDNIYLRVGVKGGGCSGFSYVLDLTETKRDSDEVWEFEYALDPDAVASDPEAAANQVSQIGSEEANESVAVATHAPERFVLRVVCDPKSYLYLNATEVDFRDELMQRGFVFNNPNATNVCGCGSSFSA